MVAALRAGRVPGRLLYQSPAQARRWLAYHQAWSPSRTDSSLEALYRAAANVAGAAVTGANVTGANVAAGMAARSSGPGQERMAGVLLLGLGCGGGRKDAAVLEALAERGAASMGPEALTPAGRLAYAPVDAAPELVLEAAREARLRLPGVALHPLVADLSAAPSLARWPGGPVAGFQRLYTCYGMLPNMDHRTFPRWLAGLVGPGDRLLVSANLFPGDGGSPPASVRAGILAQYDNLPARRWYAGCLGELGLAAEAYALTVTTQPLQDAEGALAGAFQVVVRAEMRAEVGLSLLGETIRFGAGDALEVFHSNRFSAAAARQLLTGAGLRVLDTWLHGSGEEGIFACAGTA